MSFEGLTYSAANKQLLQDIDLTISSGERVIIVGENGVGKSTFLKILAGVIQEYDGDVSVPEYTGFLPQSFEPFDESTVLGYIIEASQKPEWIDHFNAAKEHSSYKWIQDFNYLGGHELFRSLSQLGLSEELLDRSLVSLSGGEKTKAHLCALVHSAPDLLVLDEPTNHLDLQGIRWLESHLRRFAGSVLMVTHDRSLINNASTRIAELSSTTHDFQHFTGGYDFYLEQQAKIRKQLVQQRNQQDSKLVALSFRLNSNKNKASSETGRRQKDGNKLAYNFRGQRSQKGLGRQVRTLTVRQEDLAKNLVDIPKGRKDIEIELGFEGDVNLSLDAKGVTFGYPGKPLFSNITFSLEDGERICITGPNGSGKTSLLKIIAGLEEPQSGQVTVSPSSKIGFLDQQQESIDLNQTPSELVMSMADNFNERSAFRLLKRFGVLHPHDLNSPLLQLSIGTRRKSQLAGIVASGANILLLDEPTNHLDLTSLEQVEQQLQIFQGIVIAISHDRHFIEYLGATELKISNQKKQKRKNVNKQK